MESDVTVREVGLRDGLQLVKQFFPTAAKKRWIAAELAAGVRNIEVTSFVPAKVLAQFADAEEIAAYSLQQPGLVVSVLVPNLKGAERAFAAGVHKIGFPLSASESHNQANVRKSVDQSLEDFRRIIELRNSNPAWHKIPVEGIVSTSFGCTIEGMVPEDKVIRLAEKYAEYGADQVALADTVGYANPVQVKRMFTRLRRSLGEKFPVSAHFHDTRGLGLANAYAALETGVRSFDASLAGMGGCPFAPEATGNIVTEDLVFMLESAGLRTGIDLERLIEVRKMISENLPDEPLHGLLARAKLPKGFVSSSAPVAV